MVREKTVMITNVVADTSFLMIVPLSQVLKTGDYTH